jgi:hypothetical protein
VVAHVIKSGFSLAYFFHLHHYGPTQRIYGKFGSLDAMDFLSCLNIYHDICGVNLHILELFRRLSHETKLFGERHQLDFGTSQCRLLYRISICGRIIRFNGGAMHHVDFNYFVWNGAPVNLSHFYEDN